MAQNVFPAGVMDDFAGNFARYNSTPATQNIKYDNCKTCHSSCAHAGKDREFVCPNGISCKVERPKTNAEVLCECLKNFDHQEDFIQEGVADYIACPSVADCEYDGVDNSCCAACKVKWLLSAWEG